MKVAIVGATGVLGRRVVPRLQAMGHEVVALARSAQSAARLGSVAPLVGDVWNPTFLSRAFHGADAVMMLATAIPAPAQAGRAKGWRTNDAVRSVLAPMVARTARACGVSVLVQESVFYVYADGAQARVTEESLVEPATQVETCLTAEHAAHEFRMDREAHARSVVLRFASFVAPDSDQTRAVAAAARQGSAVVLGAENGYTAFIHVDDAAAAAVHALQVPSGVYNAGGAAVQKSQWLGDLGSAFDVAAVRPPPAVVRRVLPVALPMVRVLERSIRLDSTKLLSAGWSPGFPDDVDIWRQVASELSND